MEAWRTAVVSTASFARLGGTVLLGLCDIHNRAVKPSIFGRLYTPENHAQALPG